MKTSAFFLPCLPLLRTVLILSVPSTGSIVASQLTVFQNGKVVTVDDAFKITDAIALEDNRIVALGESAKSLSRSRSDATVIDLKGRMVLPGLMDSHSHPVGAAMTEFDHPIPDISDIPELLEYIRARSKVVAKGSLISVRQIFITRLKEQRYPTKEELDGVAPEHPVQFSTGPDSMLNSMALKLAGIDREFVVPANSSGVVVRDDKGDPTGLLHALSPKINAKSEVKQPSKEDTLTRLKALFEDYNSVGYTTIADRGANKSNIEFYEALKAQNQLSVRLRLSHTFSAGGQWRTTELGIDEIINHPLRKQDSMLQIIGTKIWLDGGMLTGSALMMEPWGVSQIYGITDKTYKGVQITPSEHLVQMVKKVSESGLQFTAHSVGDGAVQLLLDTYAEVNKTTPIRDNRHCITHSNFMTPDSIRQAAALGVVVDLQPIWFFLDGATLLKQFGYERMARFQPLRALVDAKVTVGGGSDHMQKIGGIRSVNPYNPWWGMWIAVERKCRNLQEPLHPEGGLTREEAIRLYTIENAKVLLMEKETGSLEVGKRADFIIIDRDILHCPAAEIQSTKVIETWLDGRRIWKSQ